MSCSITCIYCLENKESRDFSKREHVMPESFGKFGNNLTLIEKVCDDCNKFFADNLELFLARDTYEGSTLRFEHQVKDPEQFKTIGRKSRLITKVAEGPNKGIFVFREFSENSKSIALNPCPQVGFLKENGDYDYYLLDQLPQKGQLEHSDYKLNYPNSIRLLECDMKQAEKALAERGFRVKFGEGKINPIQAAIGMVCEIEGEIDDVIFRAMAKIAFNYFAHWQSTDFLIQKDFSAIRNYIRWNQTPEIPLRGEGQPPTLLDRQNNKIQPRGHFIDYLWSAETQSLVVRIYFFNWKTYHIRLAKDEFGKFRGLKKGHFFDLDRRTIKELAYK